MMYKVSKIFKLNKFPELGMLASKYILLTEVLQFYRQT